MSRLKTRSSAQWIILNTIYIYALYQSMRRQCEVIKTLLFKLLKTQQISAISDKGQLPRACKYTISLSSILLFCLFSPFPREYFPNSVTQKIISLSLSLFHITKLFSFKTWQQVVTYLSTTIRELSVRHDLFQCCARQRCHICNLQSSLAINNRGSYFQIR